MFLIRSSSVAGKEARTPTSRPLDTSRQVDNDIVMARKIGSVPQGPTARKIIGISLSPELASKVKAEAGRRQISLRRLFEELWELYERHGGETRR